MFKGSIVALVTPFQNEKIDEKSFVSLIEWHIQQGTHGLLVCASTGESFLLSFEEQRRLIELAVKTNRGRLPLLAGTSAITTKDTIFLTRQAKEAGADAALIVAPPYIRPSQEALYHHFATVHDAVNLPIMVYNNPKRAAVSIDNETLVRLAKLDRIIGVKDATNELERPVFLRLLADDKFLQFTGEDSTTVAFLAHGGHGAISVTANVAPQLCAQLYEAWDAQEFETVSRLRDQLMPLHRAVFTEPSPAPSKYALSLLGLCSEEVRRPLFPLSPAGQQKVKEAMIFAGILKEKEVFNDAQ